MVGYEGLYEVSDLGRVKSLGRTIQIHRENYTTRVWKEKILKPKISSKYHRVWLCTGSNKRIYGIHRLVAEAFIPNPENKPQVNHIDGNPANNLLSNLEWVTQSENTRHAVSIGRKLGLRGEKCPTSKVTDIQRLEILALYECGLRQTYIGNCYGISQGAVSYIVKQLKKAA